MRLDSAILIAKGTCHVLIGAFTPWTAALAQWANTGEFPSPIVWLGIITPASIVGGASGLLAFLSGAYQKYLDDKAPRQALQDEVDAKKKIAEAEQAAKMKEVVNTAKLEELKTDVTPKDP